MKVTVKIGNVLWKTGYCWFYVFLFVKAGKHFKTAEKGKRQKWTQNWPLRNIYFLNSTY